MNDKLYFAATGATPYLLEIDPAKGDATQIVCYSETPQSASISTGIRGLTVYKDMLVATMIGNNGAYMVASKNPSEGPESFETICTQQDLLDYPHTIIWTQFSAEASGILSSTTANFTLQL